MVQDFVHQQYGFAMQLEIVALTQARWCSLSTNNFRFFVLIYERQAQASSTLIKGEER